MREIKFHLWNIKEKRMYHFEPSWGNYGRGGGWIGGVPLNEYEKNGRTFAPSNQWQLEPEGCEWLQFTGLHDKQGKEVYEGDVVQRYGEGRYKVYWHEFTASWCMDGHTDITKGDLAFACEVIGEVIGNIYENPELLEVK